MTNVTLSMDEKLVAAGRRYAGEHDTTLNALLRRLLAQAVVTVDENWLDHCFQEMDDAGGGSKGKHWRREDLYDV